MKRNFFAPAFGPRLGGSSFSVMGYVPLGSSFLSETEKEARQKKDLDNLCDLRKEHLKAKESEKSNWKHSFQSAVKAYANKYNGGNLKSTLFDVIIKCSLGGWESIDMTPVDLMVPGSWWNNPKPGTTSTTPRPGMPTGQMRPSPLAPGYQDVATPSAMRPATMQPSSFEPVAAQRPVPVRQDVATQAARPAATQPIQPSFEPVATQALTPSAPAAQASQYQWRETPQYEGTPWPGTPTASQAAAQGGGDCPPGQFRASPGGPCRGSVGAMPSIPGGIMNPSAMTAATATIAPTSMPATSLAGRRVALRGVHSGGNIEWWGYQQSFIPPLYFSRPRVNRATLGVGKPVPPGICCQATPDGGAICSTGQGFPPTCPNKPEPNVPGFAEYINQNGFMVPKPPLTPVGGVCGGAPAEKSPKDEDAGAVPVIGLAAVAALLYAVVDGLV